MILGQTHLKKKIYSGLYRFLFLAVSLFLPFQWFVLDHIEAVPNPQIKSLFFTAHRGLVHYYSAICRPLDRTVGTGRAPGPR